MRIVFLSFAILCLSYFAVTSVWFPSVVMGEDQEARNIISAEELIYAAYTPGCVVVGSSLINGFGPFTEDNDLVFLPQGGGSAREGLDLLCSQGISPQIVMVEGNALTVTHRPEFVDRFTSPLTGFLAQHIRTMRYKYRPVTFILSGTRAMLSTSGKPEDDGAGSPRRSSEAFQLRLNILEEHYKEPPLTGVYKDNLDAVCQQLSQLEQRGCKIVLLEFPVHERLLPTNYHKERRKLLFDAAEEMSWQVLDWANLSGAGFTDGIHYDRHTRQALVRKIERVVAEIDADSSRSGI